MKKNLLLVAASVAALAAAGAANSADLSVSLATVNVTPTAPYPIADVLQSGTLQGDLVVKSTYLSNLPQSNNLLVTITLTNATFVNNNFLAADLTLLDGSVAAASQQSTVSSVETVGNTTTVKFLVSAQTQEVNGVRLNSRAIRFAAGATPTVSVHTQTEAGTSIEGGLANFGSAKAATLVSYEDLVTVEVEASENKAILSLLVDDIFSVLDTAKSEGEDSPIAIDLGTVTAKLDNVYLPALSAGIYNLPATPVSSTAVQSLTFVPTQLSGSPLQTGVAVAPSGTFSTFSAGNGGFHTADVALTLSGDNAKLNEQYKLQTTVTFKPEFNLQPVVFNSDADDLIGLRRDGVSAEIPWVASTTVANANKIKSTVRVANKGEAAAAVYAEYVTSNNKPAAGTKVGPGIPVQVGTVQPGQDLQITQNGLTTALGEWGRGNIVLTIEANSDDITVNNRVVQASGEFVETTVIVEDNATDQ